MCHFVPGPGAIISNMSIIPSKCHRPLATGHHRLAADAPTWEN